MSSNTKQHTKRIIIDFLVGILQNDELAFKERMDAAKLLLRLSGLDNSINGNDAAPKVVFHDK